MRRGSLRSTGRALTMALLILPAAVRPVEAPSAGHWNFRVLLDGKPIGVHRFTLWTDNEHGDGERRLRSEAHFEVRLLGLTVYRYRHEATERWRGDCLRGLDAETDDDGKRLDVRARRDGAALAVQSPQGDERLDGCVMSFAYWHPAMLKQARLLNAQTGRYEDVRVEALGEAMVESQGHRVAARHYRLHGPEQPIELWYAADGGDWLALESKVSGGRRTLSYRRE